MLKSSAGWVTVFACTLLISCYQPNPATECGGAMACDAAPQLDTTTDSLSDGCAATTCSNNVLSICGQPQVCSVGCATSGEVRCNDVLPSNNVRDWNLAATTLPLTVANGNLSCNTDTGEIRRVISDTVVRPAGAGVKNGIFFDAGVAQVGFAGAVFAVRDLTVQANATLQFVGSNPVVMLVDGTATIAGKVTASADVRMPFVPGAGGGTGGLLSGENGTGCGPGHAATSSGFLDGGGGGGGNRGLGGAGGLAGSINATAGAAGSICVSGDLQPLLAGSGGGAGGGMMQLDINGVGGAGGGALQLSVRGELLVSATGSIAANGGGGGGGRSANSSGGGGGGGSGGGLLIEASQITIAGGIFANGGGGGGAGSNMTVGLPGASGSLSSNPAAGGVAAIADDAGAGGAGGTVAAPLAGMDAVSNGGGGGGAAGRIVLRSYTVVAISGEISPPAIQLPLQLQ